VTTATRSLRMLVALHGFPPRIASARSTIDHLQEPIMTKPAPPLRYSLAATMAKRTGQLAPEAKPFNLAQAMREKVERDRSAG